MWPAAPFGDPAETTTAPRHRCDDVVVRAHGAVTRAAELARCSWEVQQLSRGQDQSNLSSALVNSAVLRLRMFDIDGAYEDLQRASALQPLGSDARLQLLSRYSAQLKAPRSEGFLQQDLSGAAQLLAEVRQVFLANGRAAQIQMAKTW
ncbi:unnamed protein product, partial [Effrenium voratum]